MHKHLQQCKGKFQDILVGSTLVANCWIFRNFVSKKNGVVSALMMSKRFHCQRCQFCLLFHWLWHCGESLKSSTLRPQKGSNYTYERTLDLINPQKNPFAKMTWLALIGDCLIPHVTHQFFYASRQQSVYCRGQLSKGDLGWPPMLGHKSPIVVHILFLFFDIRSGRKRWV